MLMSFIIYNTFVYNIQYQYKYVNNKIVA